MNQLAAILGSRGAGQGTHAWPLHWPAAFADWIDAERGRFFPWLAASMVAGSALYFVGTTEPPWWYGLAAFAMAVAIAATVWRSAPLRGVALASAAVALGFASAQWAATRPAPMEILPTRAVTLSARIRGVDILPEGRRLVLEDVRLGNEQPPLARLVRVRMKRGDTTELGAGDRIEVRALLRPPSPPPIPAAGTSNATPGSPTSAPAAPP